MKNIAEILKNCPKGTKLYSPLCGECEFDSIRGEWINTYKRNVERYVAFNYFGQHCSYPKDSECLLFPSKENRDWDKFCPFKDGDIVVSEDAKLFQMFILKKIKYHENDSYDGYCYFGWDFDDNQLFSEGIWGFNRLATEEEKQKLFDTIKANGYKWNAETKTLEKLIVPKFKIGDEIVKRNSISNSWIVSSVSSEYYGLKLPNGSEGIGVLTVSEQDDYELVSNKFDITTLIPFESRVLIRVSENDVWKPAIWGAYNNIHSHITTYGATRRCIPYENNEHLLGTTDDCAEYYKTW